MYMAVFKLVNSLTSLSVGKSFPVNLLGTVSVAFTAPGWLSYVLPHTSLLLSLSRIGIVFSGLSPWSVSSLLF